MPAGGCSCNSRSWPKCPSDPAGPRLPASVGPPPLHTAGAPALEDRQQAVEAAGLNGAMLVLKWQD